MSAGYVGAWVSFDDAVGHIEHVRGCSREDAETELIRALRDGAVLSEFADDGEPIDRRRWYQAVLVIGLGHLFVGDPGPPRSVEVRRDDLERTWLPRIDEATAQKSETPITCSEAAAGIRTNKAAAAEQACRQWIAGLTERPANKDETYVQARAAVVQTGQLSRKAFERAWAREAPVDWRLGGRRKKAR